MPRSLHLAALLGLSACAAPVQNTHDVASFDLNTLQARDYNPSLVLVGQARALPSHVRFQGQTLPIARTWDALNSVAIQVPDGVDALDVVRELRASGEYAWVEPDLVRTASAIDPYRAYQWNFDSINLDAAWAYTTGTGAVVAVLDTGVTSGPNDGISHLGTGWDFAYDDADPADGNGHGSHVSGTINQATNNGAGASGIAYGATIMPVKVLDDSGSGYSSDVIDGIYYAANNGADVINMSLGSSRGSATEEAAVDYAWSMGVFIASAAGNSGTRGCDYPAAYSTAFCVGATDFNNDRVRYSNWGNDLNIMAPGGDTSTDDNGDGYADGILQETFESGAWGFYFWQGTSMATPHVAGVAALLSSMGADNATIWATLEDTALDLGSAGFDAKTGWGLLDAEAAVASYAPPVDDDGDGWTVADGDCDDTDASVYPGAPETWYDGIDSDCDGASDYDADLDGYDSDLYGGLDCDDTTYAVNPGATEVCEDGIDNDCDGTDATCSTGDTTPPVVTNISDSYNKRSKLLQVTFDTDELATGEVCTDKGDCATTTLGTSHDTGSFSVSGHKYTVYATDEAGNTSSYGPYRM